jgi:hypothetical protein
MTIGPLLTSAAEVVSPFGSLIVLVAGLTLGIFAVKFLISNIKRARG